MIGSLNRYQIDHLLRTEMVGRIGCSDGDLTYVVPITFVYDGQFIYCHTREGLKTTFMRLNSKVCFEVDHVTNMANWQSAIIQGLYEELSGRQAEEAMQMLVNRMHPYPGSETSVPRHGLDRPHSAIDPYIKMIVFRISIEEATGRFEKT